MINIYPNTYIVTYTDHNGGIHSAEIDALTIDEAKVRVLAATPAGTIQNITARPKPKTEKRLYKISDLWG